MRGHIVGSVRGLRVTLQAQSHVEGDIFHQSLAIEQGAYFEGKSRRSDNPLAEIEAPANARRTPVPILRVHRAWRLPPRRNSEGLSKGFCIVRSNAYRQRAVAHCKTQLRPLAGLFWNSRDPSCNAMH